MSGSRENVGERFCGVWPLKGQRDTAADDTSAFRVRLSGWDVVRTSLGLLLLLAAALKAHQLLTEPVLATSLFTSRWFLIGVVEFELVFGLWLLFGLCPRVSWHVAIGCFSSFASVSLAKGLSGEPSCGCLGSIAIHPWMTFTIDVFALAALSSFSPNRPVLVSAATTAARIWTFVVIVVFTGVTSGVALGGVKFATLEENGEIVGDNRIIILETQSWIRKRFPLLRHVNIGEQLAHGRWIVMLYDENCPKCQAVLPRFRRLAARLGGEAGAPQLALIELPPYASRASEVSLAGLVHGRLYPGRRFFTVTPAVFVLRDGKVTALVEEIETTTEGDFSKGFLGI